jgi:hypothetical protein
LYQDGYGKDELSRMSFKRNPDDEKIEFVGYIVWPYGQNSIAFPNGHKLPDFFRRDLGRSIADKKLSCSYMA